MREGERPISLWTAVGHNDPEAARRAAQQQIAAGGSVGEEVFFATYGEIIRNGNPELVGPLVSVLVPSGYSRLFNEALEDNNPDRMQAIVQEFNAQVMPNQPELGGVILQQALVRGLGDSNRAAVAEKLVDAMIENHVVPTENLLWEGIKIPAAQHSSYPYPFEGRAPGAITAESDGLIAKVAALCLHHDVSLLPSPTGHIREQSEHNIYVLTDVMRNVSLETAQIVTVSFLNHEREMSAAPEAYATNHENVMLNIIRAKSVIKDALAAEDSAAFLDNRTGRFSVKFYPSMFKLLPKDTSIPESKRSAVEQWALKNLEKGHVIHTQSPWSWDKFRVRDTTITAVQGLQQHPLLPSGNVRDAIPEGPLSLIMAYVGGEAGVVAENVVRSRMSHAAQIQAEQIVAQTNQGAGK